MRFKVPVKMTLGMFVTTWQGHISVSMVLYSLGSSRAGLGFFRVLRWPRVGAPVSGFIGGARLLRYMGRS